MDSMKLPKNTSTKVSVPVAIKFTAGDDSVEDVTATTINSNAAKANNDSLSSSPIQGNSDDSSWRKDFLQGGFFSRKRSGSVEVVKSPSSANSSHSLSLLDSNSATVGTWKLIKGRVSQAMDDIKLSNNKNETPNSNNNNNMNNSSSCSLLSNNQNRLDDSDDDDGNDGGDSATLNSSISDEFNETAGQSATQTPQKLPTTAATATPKNINTDSDSDVDSDLVMMPDNDAVILKKSFDNLRYRKRGQSTKDAILSKINKHKEEWRSSSSSSRASVKNKKDNDNLAKTNTKPDTKRYSDIESGVEITEEMTLSTNGESNANVNEELTAKRLPSDTLESSSTIEPNTNDVPTTTAPITCSTVKSTNIPNNTETNNSKSTNTLKTILLFLYHKRSWLISLIIGSLLCLIASMPPFLQGVLTCLFVMQFLNTLWDWVQSFLVSKIRKVFNENDAGEFKGCDNGGPERSVFAIPDYSKMPVCEIPIIEEHKQIKSYSGWMNEINNYDPANFHISMTRSVFIKLDGSSLRISSTNARIPKRTMWNEKTIDRKRITFTDTRNFDLLGCSIEMCPRGLAKKRHFNRKYPIQLLIKNSSPKNEHIFDFDEVTSPQRQKSDSFDKTPASKSNKEPDQMSTISHQSSNDSVIDDRLADSDLGETLRLADLQKLQPAQVNVSKDMDLCGDDVRILLFARCDREKEDWYRRFTAASAGNVVDQELKLSDMVIVNDDDIVAALREASNLSSIETNLKNTKDSPDSIEEKPLTTTEKNIESISSASKSTNDVDKDDDGAKSGDEQSNTKSSKLFKGLLMTSCAARSPPEYIKFMSRYQNACSQKAIPVIQAYPGELNNSKKNRRERKQEDELWKGIDQSLYLGPSGSVVWANVLAGRILFSCLNDQQLLGNIQEFLQKKLSAIKLPSFMEEVIIAQVNLGDKPPLIHRVSQPLIDERGTWIDADVTYEGLMHMTITTKLNLLRLKRQHSRSTIGSMNSSNFNNNNSDLSVNSSPASTIVGGDAIYDSNAESSGASSSESDSPSQTNVENLAEQPTFSQGSSKKFLRIVDRITASNLFQSATEIPYIQKAMENMSTKIRLRVELKGLVARCTVNIPAPPSDRIWMGFRGPPRLWISATPALGDHTFDWSIVTNAIESKLCEEVSKYLVYPNMVDMIAPFLGHSTYKE